MTNALIKGTIESTPILIAANPEALKTKLSFSEDIVLLMARKMEERVRKAAGGKPNWDDPKSCDQATWIRWAREALEDLSEAYSEWQTNQR